MTDRLAQSEMIPQKYKLKGAQSARIGATSFKANLFKKEFKEKSELLIDDGPADADFKADSTFDHERGSDLNEMTL